MLRKTLAALLLACLLASTAACFGRVPSNRRAQSMIAGYFKKYGKQYRQTDFGQFPVSRVEIQDVHETKKNFAEVEAFVTLGKGAAVYRVMTVTQKKAFGWRIIGWENLGQSS